MKSNTIIQIARKVLEEMEIVDWSIISASPVALVDPGPEAANGDQIVIGYEVCISNRQHGIHEVLVRKDPADNEESFRENLKNSLIQRVSTLRNAGPVEIASANR